MTTEHKSLESAEQQLADTERLLQSLEEARQELAGYRNALSRKLEYLQNVPRRPIATPTMSEMPEEIVISTGDPMAEDDFALPTQGIRGKSLERKPPPPMDDLDRIERNEPDRPGKPLEPEAPAVEQMEPDTSSLEEGPASGPLEKDHAAREAGPAEEWSEEEEYEELDEEEAADRRAAPRRQGNPIPVRISLNHSDEIVEGWVVDRSSGGLRILTDQVISPGANLDVKPTKALPGFPWISVEVRSCQQVRGSYSLGCMFTQKVTWGQLQGFG